MKSQTEQARRQHSSTVSASVLALVSPDEGQLSCETHKPFPFQVAFDHGTAMET